MEMIFFRKFIQNCIWARTFQFWHPWRSFRPKKEVFHPMSENGFKVIFFSRKSTFFSKCFSGHTECSFDNSARNVSPKNWKISLISQNSRTFGFSQNFFPETFNWSCRMPSWRPWSFPSSQNVLSKTLKRYKNVTSCREVFLSKCSSGNIEFGFYTLGEKIWEILDVLRSESEKISKVMFLWNKNSLLLQIASVVAWSAFAATLLVIFRRTTVHFSLRAVEVKKFGFSQKIILLEKKIFPDKSVVF